MYLCDRHILPSSLSDKSENQEASFWQDAVRAKGHNGVIVYFHGVTGNNLIIFLYLTHVKHYLY